jgi:hypothetical protein
MAKRHRAVLYDDGIYQVTEALVSTPTRFYPLANTTARIRRDPLWLGSGVAAVSLAGAGVYADLLYPIEVISLIGIGLGSLVAGSRIGILCLDAIGLPKAMIITTSTKAAALFGAIRAARTRDAEPLLTEEGE